MAVDVKPDPHALGENPLIEGLERLPGPGDDADDLRRHRRPRPPQAAARALQPRPRGRAARALQPGRRRPARDARRRVPGDGQGRDREVLAPRAATRPCSRACSAACTTSGSPSTTSPATGSCARCSTQLDEEGGGKLNRAYYLSTAPEYFPVIVKALREADLNYDADVDVRCIIEKPFGTDLESALELQQVVEHVFREQQVYRIDHYLGKETVQNVMAFRFANFMFEPVWNRNYIDHIQITAAEDIGIGTRAGYYDQSGALRDLVQNHMLQLLTLVCMEPPAQLRGRQGARREGQGAAGDHAADARGGPPRHGARAVHGGRRGRRGGRRLPRGGRRPGRLAHRDLRRAAPGGPQLALGGRADLPAHRQAAGAQGDRDRGPAQAGPAPGVPVARLGRRPAQPARADDAAQRGRVAVAGREDPRLEHAHPAGEHGVPVRLGVHVAVAGGLRAADPRRDARRGDAVHAHGRGDRPVVDHRPDPEGVGGRRRAAAHVRVRLRRARRPPTS